MAVRLYLTPAISNGNFTVPSHVAAVGIPRSSYTPYGNELIYLVRADVTPAQHTAMSAFSDVFAFPADVTATLGNNASVNAAKNKLEGWKFPADWVTNGMTVREILRTLVKFFLLNQRLGGQTNKSLFDGAFTPDTTVGSLTANQRTALSTMLQSWKLDTAQVTGATTLRQIMKTAVASMALPDVDALF